MHGCVSVRVSVCLGVYVYVFLMPLSLLHGSSLFASHLCEYLSQHTLQPPDSFLTHQASLHILMAISKCMCVYGMKDHENHVVGIILAVGESGEELLRCVRPTVKMLQGLTADQRER